MANKTHAQLVLEYHVTAVRCLRSDLNRKRVLGYTWSEIGGFYGLSGAMAYRIAREGYEPKSQRIRRRLGLDPYRWRDQPLSKVRWALEHREPFNG